MCELWGTRPLQLQQALIRLSTLRPNSFPFLVSPGLPPPQCFFPSKYVCFLGKRLQQNKTHKQAVLIFFDVCSLSIQLLGHFALSSILRQRQRDLQTELGPLHFSNHDTKSTRALSFCLLVCLSETRSLSLLYSCGCLRTHSAIQACLQLTEIRLPLPHRHWN